MLKTFKILFISTQHRPGESENRALMKIIGPKRDAVTGGGEDYITRSFYSVYSPNTVQVIKPRMR